MAALRRRQPIFVCWSCRLGGALSQRRTITQNFIRKTEEAKQAWDQQAKEILEGKRQNLYDVLEERGFIKDVAPYVAFPFPFSFPFPPFLPLCRT
jgi:hypothetical protein